MSIETAPGDPLAEVAPALIGALETLHSAGRYLHPARLEQIAEHVAATAPTLQAALGEFDAASTGSGELVQAVDTAAAAVMRVIEGFALEALQAEGVLAAYRALRYLPRALDALYPFAKESTALNRFFLDPDSRDDEARLEALRAAGDGPPGAGVSHVENARGSRGGYSLYVPEDCDPAATQPVIVALHGGAGHGWGFLWTWLSTARSRGAILISPTAIGDTWSLMAPEIDSENIVRILARVGADWRLDSDRLLLTGMSDGGTFAYVSGLAGDSPFSHLAPISASFHPMMLEMIERPRVAGLPIYLTHGSLDWMFDVEVARTAHEILGAAGAEIIYREITDLSHTYPREENPLILDWFLGSRSSGQGEDV